MSTPAAPRTGLAGLLTATFELIRAHGAALVWITLSVAVPCVVLAVGAGLAFGPDEGRVYDAGTIGLFLASLVVGIVAAAACIEYVLRATSGVPGTWTAALAVTWTRMPSILLVTLLAGLGVVGGLLLLILPGIWLAVRWSMVLPALLSGDERGRAVLSRSSGLVDGRWWWTLGALLVANLMAAAVAGVAQNLLLGLLGVGAQDRSTSALVVVAAVGLVARCITIPFTSAFLVVLFRELVARGPANAAPAWASAPPPAGPPASAAAPVAAPPPAPLPGGFLPPAPGAQGAGIAPPPPRPPAAGD